MLIMEFYTETRFKNWIEKIKETDIKEDDANSLAVFDQMLEDFVIACLSIVRSVKEREIKKEEAIKEIDKIGSIVNKKEKFGSELKNEIFEFTVESIRAVLQSFRYFLEGKTSKKDFQALLNDAVKKQEKGEYEKALDLIARMGAKVIKGERLPDLELPEEGIILSWLDGVDAINAVLELSEIDAPAE